MPSKRRIYARGVTLRGRAAYAASFQNRRGSCAFARDAEPRSNPVGDKPSRAKQRICEEILSVRRPSPMDAMPHV